MNDLPDELLMNIFQHGALTEKANTYPRVCRRWKRICLDGTLWQVIDVPPAYAVTRILKKIFKQYGGAHTRVIRITSYSPNDRQSSKNVITADTWKLLMACCSNLEELYICRTNLDNFSNVVLPVTLRRLYLMYCYDTHTAESYDLAKGSEGPRLELLALLSTRCRVLQQRFVTNLEDLKYLEASGLVLHDAMHNIIQVHPWSHLTHLDIHDSNWIGYNDLMRALQLMYHLEALDISDSTMDMGHDEDLEKLWKNMWSSSMVPNLRLLKLCMLGLWSPLRDAEKFWFQLPSPFQERFGLRVVGCKVRDSKDHECELKSIMPAPVTDIRI